jgi:prepilin-type N-terminal cleavage/methylation domain-containing protein
MKRGFSLIELLVVVAIIAILVGVATPYYSDYIKDSKRSKALQDLDALKQAIVLFNSQEDLPYLGIIGTDTANPLPTLGEKDFNGLMGRYLTFIPTDPWGKNYKLDPYACFVYSEGPSSSKGDDIREYYVKDLALNKIEWEDLDNDRTISENDRLYIHFNKSVFVDGEIQANDFIIYENNEVATDPAPILNFTFEKPHVAWSETQATETVFICEIDSGTTVKLGVHSLALKDELNVLHRYREVKYNRVDSINGVIKTEVEYVPNDVTKPLRYAIRTNPIKIKPK